MYSARMKIADIITDSKILSVLERLNINLGFGEATIEEICNKYHLSTNLFLMICNIYSFDDFTPNIDGLTQNDIPKIVGYLQKSHDYWLNSCFPQLHKNIHTMLDSCDEVNKKVLNKFYDDYDVEVKKHLDYEENTVFPYILSLGKEKGTFRIKDFEENHSDLDEKLGDLAPKAKKKFLEKTDEGTYRLREEFKTQRQVESYFEGKTDEKDVRLKEGLYALISNVLFVTDRKDPSKYHPRIAALTDGYFKTLPPDQQKAY